MWFLAVLGVLLLGGIAVVASGRGTPLAPAYDDRPDALVPAAGPLRPDDLRRVRFSLALRGYRMDEVDALLARLADQLADQRDGAGGAGGTAAGEVAAAEAEGPADGDAAAPYDGDAAAPYDGGGHDRAAGGRGDAPQP
ncbi:MULTISPECIES: DivIVA domain-containing protein [Nocardioides]|uniref:DivIVA domain-containing protein n=1 Tax=Nocardioides TaxID=1839 RepID=UPI00203A925D|nr:DivIVA domain-containing protein [Nocardioides sp. P86]MCM3514327.1 DivIVA domain-containing protein [Nocardioides sp. P86]